MNFCEQIERLISKSGITAYRMLSDLQLSQNSICNWKQRGTVPSGEIILRIAEYFHVSTDYLLGHEAAFTQEEQALIQQYRLLSNEQKQKLTQQLQNIIHNKEVNKC